MIMVGEAHPTSVNLDEAQRTKFDWIEFEQPKAGPKGRIHGRIL